MASKKYEVLHGIRLPEGEVLTEGVVTLDEEAEETRKFLDYEAIRLIPGQDDAPAGNGPAALTVPDEAGRDALLANGYDSDAKVSAADDATLMGISGVGEATVRKIRQHLLAG